MKKVTLIALLLVSVTAIAQIELTSFEDPETFSGDYTDTGDPQVAHDLVNNPSEPLVDYLFNGGEIGFNAYYEPYDAPGDGLSDGDEVGVTDLAPSGSNPFPSGLQGYKISDVDGNFILEFDSFTSTSTGPSLSFDYFISETGYEGDGTINESGSDRLRIYVKHLEENTEYDILDTTGSDINDLGIEGQWNTGYVELPPWNGGTVTFQLVVEVRCNSSAEAFYFDRIYFEEVLDINSPAENDFSIVPNPTSKGFVTILSNFSGDKNVVIFNLLGQQLLQTTIDNKPLDISNLNSGVYIIKITQGNHSATKKLVVK